MVDIFLSQEQSQFNFMYSMLNYMYRANNILIIDPHYTSNNFTLTD